jgi:plasmid stabilization system protein ParE
MAFEIRYTGPAHRDVDQVLTFIAEDSSVAARKWLDGFEVEISKLSLSPETFAAAPEFEGEIPIVRSIHYHSHRIFYEVHDSYVLILRVWHTARKQLTSYDIAR